MLNIFAKPSNIEHLSLVEQKRIVITSRIALSGTILLLFYVPILAYLKQWDFLLIIIFTTIVFLIIGMLNKNGKHFIAKLLLSIEPIIHIFFVQLTQGSSVHLYNLVIVSVPFLVFNFKEQRMYCIAISLLNILCVAFCEFVNFYPQYNPFGRQEPLVWWFEYINWIGACIMVLVLISVLAFTNNENEGYLLQLLEETKKLSQDLTQTAEDAIQAEAKLQKVNQELASREEELRQNLEELQATQESLVKEKESTAYKSELFSVVAKANEKLLTQKEPLEVVEFILSTVGKVLKMDRGYYFERDSFEDTEVITVSQKLEWAKSGEFAVIDDPQMHNLPISVFNEFYPTIAKNQVYQAIVKDLPSGEFKDILLSQSIKSLIVSPVFVENKFYGFIGWDDCFEERIFTEDEVNAVYSLSSSLSSALQNIRNQMQIQQKNQELIAREEELKQNLEELQATQEQMRLAQAEAERNATNAQRIFEAAPVGLFISKVSNRTIIQANQAMAKLLKIPVYEIIGRSTVSFYASEEQAKSVFAEIIEKGKFEDKEIDLKLDDGSIITALASGQVMTLNNEKVIIAGLNDITALKKAQAELKDLAANLAKKVEEQTEEIKRSFAQMVQNEKMAALGQLVAGVAHEINTPIGAIKASAENMEESLPRLIHQALHTDVPIDLKEILEKSISQLLAQRVALTSREERAYRKQITEILEQHNIENASDIAFALVQVGLVQNVESLIPIFYQENYQEILDLLSRIGRLKVNIDTILLATNKTKKIVSALKTYTHRQTEEMLTPTNINESLETVLILYHNQMKHGVEVITDFAELPVIECYADELSQVWTNVIVNALQAMQYKGRLIIKTEVKENEILVSINDNGPGIPVEIQGKIFEPFFTTKTKGEGTGLGLDICKKIVEKHNGRIYFTSEPGNTTFYVSLPINQATDAIEVHKTSKTSDV